MYTYLYIYVCLCVCVCVCVWFGYMACSSVSKESACSAGDPGLIPGLGKSPGEGSNDTLQYPCLENLMDRGAWWAAVQGSQRVRHHCVTNTYLHTYIYTYYMLVCVYMCV